jgi:hypothetical protein
MSILVGKKMLNIQMVLFDGWILCCIKINKARHPGLDIYHFKM